MTTVIEELAAVDSAVDAGTAVLAYRLVTEQVPLGGRGTPVSPPTYPEAAGEDKAAKDKNAAVFARSTGVPVPEGREAATLGDQLAQPRIGDAVVIDSIGARGHALSEALELELAGLLGTRPPGIYVGPPTEDDVASAIAVAWKSKGADLTKKFGVSAERFEQEVRLAVEQTYAADRVSTWRASHRQTDAVIRYADDPATGKQIWSGGAIGDLIRNLSAGTGDELIATVPPAALLGFWLSSRSPRLHKLARSLVSEVIGYGASAMVRGAVKSDVLGGIPSDQSTLKEVAGELTLDHKGSAKKPEQPSSFGFGQIPGDPHEVAVICEAILLRGTLSVQALRAQLSATPEYLALAEAMGVLALLGQIDLGFRRSGADFVTGARRLTVLLADGSEVDVDLEQVREAARSTVLAHRDLLAEPIEARASRVQLELIIGRIVGQLTKAGKDVDG